VVVSCKHNFKQDTKMTEKVLHSTQDHLDTITDRGGHHVRETLEDRFFEVYAHSNESTDESPDHESAYENIDQPHANRILADIARINKEVHAEHGNSTSHEVVWEDSVERAALFALNALRTEVPEDAEDAVMTLATMKTFERATGEGGWDSEETEIDYLLKNGPGGTRSVIQKVQKTAEELGLCVNTPDHRGARMTSVADTIQQDLDKFDETIDRAHKEAKREHINRRSPEENDVDLLKFTADLELFRTKSANDGLTIANELLSPSYEEAMEIVRSGNYNNQAMSKFLDEAKKRAEYNAVAMEKQGYPARGYSRVLAFVVDEIPDDRLRSMYQSKQDNESGTLKYILRREVERLGQDPTRDQASGIGEVMTRIYGLDAINLKRQVTQKDPIAYDMTRLPQYRNFMLRSNTLIRRESFQSIDEYKARMERWTADCLEDVVGLPRPLANELRFAVYDRTRELGPSGHSMPGGCVDNGLLSAVIEDTAYNVDALGVDKIQQLREKAGIVNFDHYSVDQLERMSRLINGDKELIAHLQAGDVTTTFTVSKGDHNGAFSAVSRVFEKPSGRSLFFEINQPSDFYRHSILLKNLGIADSTRMLGAHGGNGAMWFGRGTDRFSVGMNQVDSSWTKSIKVGDIPGIRAIASDYMQESRAIDDPDSMKGRKRLIILSCSQAMDDYSFTPDGRREINSTARSFASNANQSNLDVYGAGRDVSYGGRTGDFEFYDGGAYVPIREISVNETDPTKLNVQNVPKLRLWK
jgi:hypothetical protein